ncbi:MAG: hypothetical protein HC876_02500 [Chloroflexaceae bacterium]|nr:hypothetical protein [Chloroflexaceae bacterium]
MQHVRRLGLFGLVLVSLLIAGVPAVRGNTPPDEGAFQRVWEAADGAVASGEVERPWYWGPASAFTLDEAYNEGVEGTRRVQYWDKGRMEISNPNDDPFSPWYVTSGLLPIEMISGRVQIGDTRFERRERAQIPIAGDPGIANNPEAPTYADFFDVTTLFLDSRLQPITNDPIGPIAADSAAPPRFGDLVAEMIDMNGDIVRRPDLAAQYPGTRLIYYDGVLSHNIPEVFWNFLQQIGPMPINGEARQDMAFDWLYLMGHPASEPYWIRTNIDGVPHDLLVQVYERRVLTYNPANEPGWQVELGNVGQHYYLWRYELTCPPPPPNFVRPPNVNATVSPEEGPAGTDFAVYLTGFEPGEPVSLWLTLPDDSVLEAPELGAANANGEAMFRGVAPITIFTRTDDPIGVWALTGQATAADTPPSAT